LINFLSYGKVLVMLQIVVGVMPAIFL